MKTTSELDREAIRAMWMKYADHDDIVPNELLIDCIAYGRANPVQPKPTAGDEADAREYVEREWKKNPCLRATDAFLAGRQSSACKDLELLRDVKNELKIILPFTCRSIITRIEARIGGAG